LTVSEYFNSTHGARKGLSDTALKTANSGYLTRRLVDVAQDCVIHEKDCGTTNSITLTDVMEGGNIVVALGERVLGRTIAEDVIDNISGECIAKRNTLIDEDLADQIEKSAVDSVKVRSVLTCEADKGICAACYGRDLARGTPVNVGEAVGIIAAQSIGEPGTQLTMRTFHIGGAAQGAGEESSLESPFEGTISFKNETILENKDGQFLIMNRHTELVILDERQCEKYRRRLSYGTKVMVKAGDKVSKGQVLAEWDPFTVPVISEASGTAHFVDLIDGSSMREVTDEETGISNRVVVDWRQQTKGVDLKPRIVLRDAKGNPIKFASGAEAQYYLPVDTILTVDNNQQVQPGDIIGRIPKESSKTRDITGGLPRVVELFEARMPKDFAMIAELDGRVEFGKDYKAKRRLIIVPEGDQAPVEYLVPKGRHIVVHEGDYVKKGEMLIEGSLVPHDILRILGVEALADYIVQEIQAVYRLQGVRIDDKHIEVITRQMLQKHEVIEPGDSIYSIGDTLDVTDVKQINKMLADKSKKLMTTRPMLKGITRASLQTKSFISAASFQETTRVLTEAASSGKVDNLVGLKENIIIGRLVPAGTGHKIAEYRKLSAERDRQILADQEALEESRRAKSEESGDAEQQA
jgi:DNA-directed RNA polymerase subunit beta'